MGIADILVKQGASVYAATRVSCRAIHINIVKGHLFGFGAMELYSISQGYLKI